MYIGVSNIDIGVSKVNWNINIKEAHPQFSFFFLKVCSFQLQVQALAAKIVTIRYVSVLKGHKHMEDKHSHVQYGGRIILRHHVQMARHMMHVHIRPMYSCPPLEYSKETVHHLGSLSNDNYDVHAEVL